MNYIVILVIVAICGYQYYANFTNYTMELMVKGTSTSKDYINLTKINDDDIVDDNITLLPRLINETTPLPEYTNLETWDVKHSLDILGFLVCNEHKYNESVVCGARNIFDNLYTNFYRNYIWIDPLRRQI